jgi:predicted NUDIX family NTP pyrophosphohydrolase
MEAVLFNSICWTSARGSLAAETPAELIDGYLVFALMCRPAQFEGGRNRCASAANDRNFDRLLFSQVSPLAIGLSHPAAERTSNIGWTTSTAGAPVVLTRGDEALLKMSMQEKSAGLLLYRQVDGQLEVFLVHPGGPFWEKKDDGAWSIPKGLLSEGEDLLKAAKREFEEETGTIATGQFDALEPARQPSGKTVYAWMVRGDLDAASIKSNLFSIEWPRGSGVMREFPEVDKGAWFGIDVARRKILKGQLPFLDQLERRWEREAAT